MFSYLENAILGFLKAAVVRNICFHIIKYSLSDLWPRRNPSVSVPARFPVSP